MLFFNKISKFLHRGARSGRMAMVRLGDAGAARRQRNPLKELTPQWARGLYDLYREGKYADVMIAWEALEEMDETLATVVDRRQSALGEMEWGIRTDAQAIGNDAALAKLAEAQQEHLAAHFRRVANITEAVKWLGLASFRKFAHLEVVTRGRDILWLPIRQSLLFRPLGEGKWLFNEDSQVAPGRGEEMDESRLIVREVARPIDLPCMFLVIAKRQAVTQWDGFMEVFGIPSMFFQMPLGTSEEQRQDYIEVINKVIGDGRGVMPAGADVKTVETSAANGDAFASRADWCDKGIVRRGTGGQLTVLTEAGSGTLAGNAQQETFRMLAADDAADIASCINRQYTRRVLDEAFPGKPQLAYWALEFANVDEAKQKTDTIVQLAAAGWRPQDETVSEIVGFEVQTMAAPVAQGDMGMPAAPVANACNQYSHDAGCGHGGGGDDADPPADVADPRTKEANRAWEGEGLDPSRPIDEQFTPDYVQELRDSMVPEDEQEDPYADQNPTLGEMEEEWRREESGDEDDVVTNSSDAAPGTTEASDDSPLTAEELAAMQAALQGGISSEAIAADADALEQAMRGALTDVEDEDTVVANARAVSVGGGRCDAKNPATCPVHGTGAMRHKQKGGRKSGGNPASRRTQSNTPLKAAEGATPSGQRRAVGKAIKATRKGGQVQGVFTRSARGGGTHMFSSAYRKRSKK